MVWLLKELHNKSKWKNFTWIDLQEQFCRKFFLLIHYNIQILEWFNWRTIYSNKKQNFSGFWGLHVSKNINKVSPFEILVVGFLASDFLFGGSLKKKMTTCRKELLFILFGFLGGYGVLLFFFVAPSSSFKLFGPVLVFLLQVSNCI